LNIFTQFSGGPDDAPVRDGPGDVPDGDDEPAYDAPDDERDDGPAPSQTLSWKRKGVQPRIIFSF
jgi:hypothetical protein